MTKETNGPFSARYVYEVSNAFPVRWRRRVVSIFVPIRRAHKTQDESGLLKKRLDNVIVCHHEIWASKKSCPNAIFPLEYKL